MAYSHHLSLFLFIFAIEGLNNLFETAKVKGWIRGSQMGNNTRNNLHYPSTQYVDDTHSILRCSGGANADFEGHF